jgi:hypothetical protein
MNADDELVAAVVAFFLAVDSGRKVRGAELHDLRGALETAGERWIAEDQVPRQVTSALVEMYPSLLNAAARFDDLRREEVEGVAVELTVEVIHLLARPASGDVPDPRP